MTRLTFEGNFCDISQCAEIPCPCDNNCDQRQIWERLKAYEDTGLAPSACAKAATLEKNLAEEDWTTARLLELWKADHEGRLLILPAKRGQRVYFTIKDLPEFYPETNGWYIGETTITGTTDGGFIDAPDTFAQDITPWSAIGNYVFLTRKEAEKALEARKNDE